MNRSISQSLGSFGAAVDNWYNGLVYRTQDEDSREPSGAQLESKRLAMLNEELQRVQTLCLADDSYVVGEKFAFGLGIAQVDRVIAPSSICHPAARQVEVTYVTGEANNYLFFACAKANAQVGDMVPVWFDKNARLFRIERVLGPSVARCESHVPIQVEARYDHSSR